MCSNHSAKVPELPGLSSCNHVMGLDVFHVVSNLTNPVDIGILECAISIYSLKQARVYLCILCRIVAMVVVYHCVDVAVAVLFVLVVLVVLKRVVLNPVMMQVEDIIIYA